MVSSTVVNLVRGWATDWLTGHDTSVCERIMSPQYSLLIGAFHLGPRAEYISATISQLFDRFPDVAVVPHRVVSCGNQAALVFSESGTDVRQDARKAVWSGIALFREEAGVLTACFAEEDYLGRRHQLRTGKPCAMGPAPEAPWEGTLGVPNPAAEATVRDWLCTSDVCSAPVRCEDEAEGVMNGPLLEVTGCHINEIFSSGEDVGFHATQAGTYIGSLADTERLVGRHANLEVAGVVTVDGGSVVAGHIVRDRLGLVRAAAGRTARKAESGDEER